MDDLEQTTLEMDDDNLVDFCPADVIRDRCPFWHQERIGDLYRSFTSCTEALAEI